MKQIFLLGTLVFSLAMVTRGQVQKTMTKEDSIKISIFDKLFGKEAFKGKAFDVELPIALAEAGTRAYERRFRASPQASFIRNAYTSNVEFGSQELGDWLAKVDATSDYNNLRIFLCVYTPEFESTFPGRGVKLNRTSVILWPYKDDEPARTLSFKNGSKVRTPGELMAAFNLGELHP